MERIGKPPYQKLCRITAADGKEYEAKLIKLNKYAGKQELWRKEGDLPKKQRYLKPSEVKAWQEI